MARLQRYAVRVRERRAKLASALGRFLEVCRGDPSACAVYIFGSYASGHVGPTSDVDVLLVRNTSLSGHSRGTDLLTAANTQALIDLLVVTPTELADRLTTTSFGRTILSSMQRIDAA